MAVAELKFKLLDSIGAPVYCDPDFYPIARAGGEQASALAAYPTIRADAEVYPAILAHEHLSSGDLSDAQKLVLYRAWKLLRALSLTPRGGAYVFAYRVMRAGADPAYQMVSGTIATDGSITVGSRIASGPPPCPICLAASTMISTPSGPLPVTEVGLGTIVWTESVDGRRFAAPVVQVGSTPVPSGHLMVHLTLADGRELLASPGHRTGGGLPLGTLAIGDRLDGSTIVTWELVPYAGARTYDLLPAGVTGEYWADGILLSSTLKP